MFQLNNKLKKYMTKLIAESEEKGHQILITEDFRESIRKSFRFEEEQSIKLKLYQIERQYYDKVSKLRRACYKKGIDVINRIREKKCTTR